MDSEALTKILRRKSDDLYELHLFAEICQRALRRATVGVEEATAYQKMSVLLGSPIYSSDEELQSAKKKLGEVAEFATTQITAGSPYLFGLCAVRLWTVLEATIDDVAAEVLKRPDECKNQVLLTKLKGPLVPFRLASPEEQAEFLAETLKHEVDAGLKTGVGRFEAVLDPLGLAGAVDDDARRVLYELSQVRNIVVHKGGVADRRLIEGCPWLKLQRGQPVLVNLAMFQSYLTAAYWYLVELRQRIHELCGGSRSEEFEQALRDAAASLRRVPATSTGTQSKQN